MTVRDIHRGVLENLLDGVLVVGSGGRVETLNPAAERILGLEPGEAAGRSFGELFIARDGFDEFTQVILDATMEEAGPERRVVEVETGGRPRSLSVATSYLRMAGEGGAAGARAAIAVFSDISELRELRETELRLAKAAEEQHGKLQDAYREIEERNGELAMALRKVRAVQGLGMVVVVGMFLGAGLWTWRPLDLSLDLLAGLPVIGGEAAAVSVEGDGAAGLRTLTVKPRRNSSSITLKGRLSPWREVKVKGPGESTIAAVNFEMGDRVAEGQVLLELDLSKQERKFRSKLLAFRKAQRELDNLKNWERSAEVLDVRRAFSKAQMSMERERSVIEKSRFLFKQGLMATAEFENAKRAYQTQLLDFEAATEQLAAVRAQADEDAIGTAELALENARADMRVAREALERESIRAPFGGTVFPAARSTVVLSEGGRVRQGDGLFRIADFSRIAATARADEIDVIKLSAGQKVTVTGNAFPGVRLKGVVKSVSGEADPRQKRKPVFHVSVLLDELEPAAQARVRPGMSVKIRIVTYDNPKALLVPLGAVRRRDGKHSIRVLDPASGEVEEREVTIGPTTRRRVEIASGLKPGEQVVLSGG